MPSALSIANKALSACKADPLASLEARSREATLCSTFLPSALAEGLTYFRWPEAKAAAWLNRLDPTQNSPSGKWSHTYALPGDCATPWYIPGEDSRDVIPYELFLVGSPPQKALCTNSEKPLLYYATSKLTPELMSEQLAELVGLLLARLVAGPLLKQAAPRGGDIRSQVLQQIERDVERIKATLISGEPEIVDIDFIPLAIREQFA